MINVLFVCLGNICRSPMAEGIFNHLVKEKGADGLFKADSAGTAGYHIGETADDRTIAVSAAHGIEITHRARKFSTFDFDNFDYIVTMDSHNKHNIMMQAWKEGHSQKVILMRDFDDKNHGADVPDPYYGSDKDFEDVFNVLKSCNDKLINFLKEKHYPGK